VVALVVAAQAVAVVAAQTPFLAAQPPAAAALAAVAPQSAAAAVTASWACQHPRGQAAHAGQRARRAAMPLGAADLSAPECVCVVHMLCTWANIVAAHLSVGSAAVLILLACSFSMSFSHVFGSHEACEWT